MNIIILISLDLLFIILLACCVSLDKRVVRLERDTRRAADAVGELQRDVRRLTALRLLSDSCVCCGGETDEGSMVCRVCRARYKL
jgi:hypothetical protein